VSPDGLKATGYVDTPEAAAGMKLYQSLFTKKLTSPVAIARAWEDSKAASRFSSITTAVQNSVPATSVSSSGQ